MSTVAQIVLLPARRPGQDLGIRMTHQNISKDYAVGDTINGDSPIKDLFNMTGNPKLLTEELLALITLLTLARVEPSRAAMLGCEPDFEGAIAVEDMVAIPFFAKQRHVIGNTEKLKNWAKSLRNRFAAKPRAILHIDVPNGRIGLRIDRACLSFALGAAEAAVEWLQGQPDVVPTSQQKNIKFGRLPRGAQKLVGREQELMRLSEALDHPKPTVVAIIGPGGCGKSSLVSSWILGLAPQYEAIQSGFDWSFYAQGSSAPGAGSAETFLLDALRHFGDPTPSRGTPKQKVDRLVNLITKQRTLLVLDGLEPLQNPVTGKITDPSLNDFLRSLAWRMNGLCVITTRPPFRALADLDGLVEHVHLGNLQDADGAMLLEQRGVDAAPEQLRSISARFLGHPLALTLYGTLVARVAKGNPEQADAFLACGEADVADDRTDEGRHARRIIEEYDRLLGDGPERAILRIMGLFDRPAAPDLLRALRGPPTIPGVNDKLLQLSEAGWNSAVHSLTQAKILLDGAEPGWLDMHPLIRHVLAQHFERLNPDQFREAHGRLHERLRDSGPEEDSMEDTLEELEPLLRAIWHAAKAHRWSDAFRLYRYRIRRNNRHFSLYHINAVSADLAAQSVFLDRTGAPDRARLEPSDVAWLLSARAFSMRALGDVQRAQELLIEASRAHEELGQFLDASIAEGNLAEMWTLLGNLDRAVVHCDREVSFARQSGDVFMSRLTRGHKAHILHYCGDLVQARQEYDKARAQVATCPSSYPLLALYEDVVFVWWYWELVFEMSDPESAARAIPTTPRLWPVGEAFIHMIRARLASLSGKVENASQLFDSAIVQLRSSGEKTWLAIGLLSRARCRAVSQPQLAREDVQEARKIIGAANMRLSKCDAHMIEARMFALEGATEKAKEHLGVASKLIRETGYRARCEELRELAASVQRRDNKREK